MHDSEVNIKIALNANQIKRQWNVNFAHTCVFAEINRKWVMGDSRSWSAQQKIKLVDQLNRSGSINSNCPFSFTGAAWLTIPQFVFMMNPSFFLCIVLTMTSLHIVTAVKYFFYSKHYAVLMYLRATPRKVLVCNLRTFSLAVFKRQTFGIHMQIH